MEGQENKMVITESTLGESMKPVEREVVEQTPAAPAPTATEQTQQAAETVETPANQSTIVVSDRFKSAAPAPANDNTQQQSPVTDWKELLKTAPKEDLLKELGLDPFAVQLNEHIKKGGSAEDYLIAKAVDYTKVPDTILAKEALKAEYPTLSDEDIAVLYNDKYKQDEYATDEEKARGSVYMKADAAKQRQRLIEQQQNFKLPESKNTPNAQVDEQAQAQFAALLEQQKQFLESHESTKSLNQNKSVVIDFGEGIDPFKFQFDDTGIFTKAILDGETWQKLVSDDKGVPDVKFMHKVIAMRLNPNYEKDLVNYGKSLGLKEVIATNRNAGIQHPPTGDQHVLTMAEAFKNARDGKGI